MVAIVKSTTYLDSLSAHIIFNFFAITVTSQSKTRPGLAFSLAHLGYHMFYKRKTINKSKNFYSQNSIELVSAINSLGLLILLDKSSCFEAALSR